MSDKALFFLRDYNDIDHIVPVIYKWARTLDLPADVVLLSAPAFLQDYRIEFLRRFEGLQFFHVDELLPPDAVAKRARHKALWRARAGDDLFSDPAMSEVFMQKVFDGIDRGVVVFDWCELSQRPGRDSFAIIDAAHRRGFVTVGLPHGDSPYWNAKFTVRSGWLQKRLNRARELFYDRRRPFDFLIAPNELTASRKRYDAFKAVGRARVMGSPRFNPEWLEIIQSIVPRYENPRGDGKLKVVLMLRNPEFPIHWTELVEAIRCVVESPRVHLVIKHHTRHLIDNSSDDVLERAGFGALRKSAPNLDVVYDEAHSSSLMSWADLSLDLGNTVTFEPVIARRPVLAADYLHTNISTIGHYLPSATLKSHSDLRAAIDDLLRDPTHLAYSDDERQNLINEMVCHPDAEVLARTVSFLQDCLTRGLKTLDS